MQTFVCEKQLAEFNAEEKDLLESLSVLMSAETVLSNHIGATAFLKVHRSLMLGVAATLRNEISKYAPVLKEKEAESKHKGFGIDDFNTNQVQTENKDCVKRDLIAKNVDLEMTIMAHTEAIDNLKAEFGEMQVHLRRTGEDRGALNKEFQLIVLSLTPI